MKNVMYGAASALLLSLAFFVAELSFVAGRIPAKIDAAAVAIRYDLNRQADELRTQTLAEIDRQALGIRKDATTQVSALRGDVFTRIDTAVGVVDQRVGDSLARVDKALGTVEHLRQDVKPAIDGAVALEKDGKDSWDDLYWDVKAAVESGTVAATSVAQTSETIRDAAPKVADSTVSIGQSFTGIAADAKREADAITKPKHWYERLSAPAYLAARIASLFF